MIEVEGLCKRFGEFVALKDVSFDVREGETLLIVGPNGAGKTTIFRCILGLLRFEGRISVNGFAAHDAKRLRSVMGYVPQTLNFPSGLTVHQVVALYSRLRGLETIPDELLGEAELDQVYDTRVDTLSGGMKQKLALVLSVAHYPSVIIMDEPLSNLDSNGRKLFSKIMRASKKSGRIVLLSVHRTPEVIHYADRILLVKAGEKLYDSSSRDFLDASKATRIKVRVGRDRGDSLQNGGVVERDGDWAVYETHNLHGLLLELASLGCDLGSMIVVETSFGDVLPGWDEQL